MGCVTVGQEDGAYREGYCVTWRSTVFGIPGAGWIYVVVSLNNVRAASYYVRFYFVKIKCGDPKLTRLGGRRNKQHSQARMLMPGAEPERSI